MVLLRELLQPFPLLFVAVAVALFLLWKQERALRRKLRWVNLLFAALYLYSIPVVAHLAAGGLEWQYDPVFIRPETAQAIVVLGGGLRPPDEVVPYARLGDETMLRCRHAATLYHSGPRCPVLVSGGKADPGQIGETLAEAMSKYLVDLGVNEADLIPEGASRTTYENAVESRRLLEERGLNTIVLVTDATHLPRSVRLFRKQGLTVIPAGSEFRASDFDWDIVEFLPSVHGAALNQVVFHEISGFAWLYLRGRL